MLAGVFTGPGQFAVEECREPSLDTVPPDWVKLEIDACGVCGTDLQIVKDPPGHPAMPGVVLGHELAAHAVELGTAVTSVQEGARVVLAPNLYCREQNLEPCLQCRRGRTNHCANFHTIGIHRDGGFARYVLAPEKALLPISPDLPLGDAVWIEPLSCVLGGFNQFEIADADTALVIGAGPIGVLHALMLKSQGLPVMVADLADARLEQARNAGVDRTVNVGDESLADAVGELTDGHGADLIVDAVGGQLGSAVDLAAIMGQICCFGLNSMTPVVNQSRLTEHELRVFGTFVGTGTFPQAIQLLEDGVLRPAGLNLTMPLADLPEGLDLCRSGTAVKVVAIPGGSRS